MLFQEPIITQATALASGSSVIFYVTFIIIVVIAVVVVVILISGLLYNFGYPEAHYVDQLALFLQRPTCLCLPNVGTKGV